MQENSSLSLINSIIWENNPEIGEIVCDDGSWWPYLPGCESLIINYSNIEGGWEGTGNIDADPLFTDSENEDFTLQDDSPCIDAGISYFEYEGEVLVDIPESEYYGLAPDMGAFEWPPETQLGDLNADGDLDVIDIVAMVNMIIALAYDSIADMNSDGVVNILDIVALLNIILDN
jgi:hypothetical protein